MVHPPIATMKLTSESYSVASLKGEEAVVESTDSMFSQPFFGHRGLMSSEMSGYALLEDDDHESNDGGELALVETDEEVIVVDRIEATSSRSKKTYLWTLVAMILVFVVRERVVSFHHHEKDRMEVLHECASHLSKAHKDPDSHSYQALLWFLGPGAHVPLKESGHCTDEFRQIFALITLRNSVSVSNEKWHEEKPSALSDVCQWPRVRCDGTRITRLVFNDAHLNGTIPPEIAGLSHLQELQLESNEGLVGPLPTELGKLVHLQSLQLQDTNVAGAVPSQFGHLTGLAELFLDHTFLSGEVPVEVCELHVPALHATCLKHDKGGLHCPCCSSCKG